MDWWAAVPPGDGEGASSSSSFDLKRKLLSVQRFNSDALFSWYLREGAMDTSRYELFLHQGVEEFPQTH